MQCTTEGCVVTTHHRSLYNDLLIPPPSRLPTAMQSPRADESPRRGVLSPRRRSVLSPRRVPVVDDRQLRSLFQLVDRDKSGFISRHELSQLFHSLHLQVSQVDVDLLIQSCDSNDDGEIDWHEFLQVMHTHSRQQQRGGDKTRDREREELLEALRAFEGPAPIDGRQPLQTEPHPQPSSGRRGLEVVGPRAGVLNVSMLDTAMELFHPVTGDAARDAKYRRMREMLQHLQVDGAGGFHYQHVRAQPHREGGRVKRRRKRRMF